MNERLEAVLNRVAEAVYAELRRQGFADLLENRWDDLEEPTVAIGDRITQKVLAKLLGDQAEALQALGDDARCRCGAALDAAALQSRTLLTRRGKVHWKMPVHYCAACRRDFFGSSGNSGNCRAGRVSNGSTGSSSLLPQTPTSLPRG